MIRTSTGIDSSTTAFDTLSSPNSFQLQDLETLQHKFNASQIPWIPEEYLQRFRSRGQGADRSARGLAPCNPRFREGWICVAWNYDASFPHPSICNILYYKIVLYINKQFTFIFACISYPGPSNPDFPHFPWVPFHVR